MDALKNIGLAAIFVGCVIWAAVAPGMQALIPLIIAIAAGIGDHAVQPRALGRQAAGRYADGFGPGRLRINRTD